MVGALVGGAFLSGFINVVFNRLLSPEAANLVIGKKLDSELVERLKTALCAAEALLVDAEHKQFGNPLLKNWLDSLQDAVYKADDLLDRIFTKAATQKEVRTFLPRFLNFQDRVMVNKVEAVVRRIEEIEKRKYILGLEKISGDNSFSWRTPSTSLVKGNIYGREDDQVAITKIINENSEHQLSVIPIVGMGGVGKTTLAQWVYSNEDLMKGFDLKAWVCISEEFDIVEVTKTIIEGVGLSSSNLKDLNLLQLGLKEKLSKQKFFIVLDDVWSDDDHSWNNFKTPFQHGAKGSTVLVTTRSEEVASIVQTCAPYFLNELSDEYCWLVFADNACFPKSNGNLALEEICRKIVKKCNGLPLAAETLGRLLRTKHDVKEWNTILMSNIWEFSAKNSKIIPALLISYNHLPAHLKRRFVYCSLFPKDYHFDKDKLVLLWMAEDLLQQPIKGETLEEVGCECFNDLTSRLFFKKPRNELQYFVMHDLLHDLAIFLARDFYCRLQELGQAKNMSIQTRHLSYGSLSHPISKNFDSIDKVKSLRSFLPINFSRPVFNTESAQCVILSKLKYLRAVSFCSFDNFNALSDSIGELIHLRYLDLSMTRIKTLPESLCELYNLQTLKLAFCSNLTVLPNGMHNLVNLRHLDIIGSHLKEMPGRMSKLKHLNFLSYFAVGRQEDNGIKELGGLSNLHGILEIRNLENVSDSGEAMGARLMDKTNINYLYLNWSSDDNIVSDTQIERDIFDKLQPHDGLETLSVSGYRGTRFSDWVRLSSYHNMTYVYLGSCRTCCMLPSLGQLPSLRSLRIEDFNELETIGAEFYKNEDDHSSPTSPFPSLVDLTFRHMPCWEVWSSFYSDPFPQLKMLRIDGCPRLKGALPNHLPALVTLWINECQQLGGLPDHLPALETLGILGCQQLVSSLPRAPTIRYLAISKSDKIGLQELPLSMQSLSLVGCQLLVVSMFQAMSITHPTCLEEIEISDFRVATSLPWDWLPESLKSLSIRGCRKLEFPHPQQRKHGLLTIELSKSCDSLTTFPLEVFPNLERLIIEGCENLDSLSLSESHYTALHHLTIDDCPNFVSFPKEGLAAPNMTSFWVINCSKLKLLPCHMNTLLPNLKTLGIDDCPEIDSFPGGGLPPNLKSLEVRKCEKLLSNLSSMGMHGALTCLTIDCRDCESSVKSFPKEGLLPPLPSLTTLHLNCFSNVETLECKELLRLTSLQQLRTFSCPKLENIAGERLPGCLWKLDIVDCPLLAERCKNKHPQIWPKISHIRSIKVNNKWVS